MYAITGITGQVGGAVAHALLTPGKSVRAVVRDPAKGAQWTAQGCELAVAEIDDVPALTAAFTGAEGVFVLLPSSFDPAPGFPEVRRLAAGLRTALAAASPARVVCLSTIGAQARRENLLTQLSILEQELGKLRMPVTFLRPAWFMENASWDVVAAREKGLISSFLQPLDRPFPMVATADVGRVAAELLQEKSSVARVVELEGPTRVTPRQIGETLAAILGRSVQVEAVPREAWHDLFISQGMKHPHPRMQMLDGFNQGWIEFEYGVQGSRKGAVTLEAVLESLVMRV
jgi:NAD(P)H dehydrogenase (quinone)